MKIISSRLVSFFVLCFACALLAHGESLPTYPGQALTLLSNGNILATGGTRNGEVVPDAYLQDRNGSVKKLTVGLVSARSGHTATVLPDGTVLVFGGIGNKGRYVRTMEIFDPQSELFKTWQGAPLVPRTAHTATLLTDGRVLLLGGIGEGGTFPSDIQTWDFRTGKIRSIEITPLFPRQGHSAKLLSDGTILLSGGVDPYGHPIAQYEIYDSVTHLFHALGAAPPNDSSQHGALSVSESLPVDGDDQFPIADLLRLRFSQLVDLSSATTSTVRLTTSRGLPVPVTVTGAELGRLVFILPSVTLRPNADYRILLSEVKDVSGNQLPNTTIEFHTEGIANDGEEDGWIPDSAALAGNWNSRTGGSSWQSLPHLNAPTGETALAGQVLGLSGRPLVHVTLSIENHKVESDSSGRFLLRGLAPGHQILVIDGTTANRGTAEYGRFEVAVDIKANVTLVLNYTIWMTKLDKMHAVHIPSPTTAPDTVISTPLLPGLELHLPAGTTIVARDGTRVTELTITPIPLDKPPFPLPTGLRVPLYFTIQPGLSEIRITGASPTKGARLYYPNSFREPGGTIYKFWNYDAASKGWYVYGDGSVTSDRSQIIPDPGVFVYELTGAMVGGGSAENAVAPGDPANPWWGGDPVSLSSGQFVLSQTDLSLPDTIPIQITRTYTTNDHYQRPFGIGTTDNYDIFLVGDKFPYTYQELVMPDGNPIRFNRTSSGTAYNDAIYLSSATQGQWYGATIYWNPNPNSPTPGSVWILRTRDGAQYGFPDSQQYNNQIQQAMLGFQDRNGNLLRLARDINSNLTRITSPNGRWIALTYDPSNRIIGATDNAGRTVAYTYDPSGRLSTVTDPDGKTTTYGYNSNDQLTAITDPKGITYLSNQYDSFGRVLQQTQADGGIYSFSWTPSTNTVQQWTSSSAPVSRYDASTYAGYTGLIAQVSITDPRGYIRQVSFDNLGRAIGATAAEGQPEQQSSSISYYSDNLIKSTVDPLGRTTCFDYDALGNLTTVTRLVGTSAATTTTAHYDQVFSNILSFTDPLNHSTSYSYDGIGNLIGVTDPLGHSTTIAYDNSEGLPTTVTDALGDSVSLSYTGGDLTSITDPTGRELHRLTDPAGRVIAETGASGSVTQYRYDNTNHLTTIIDPQQHQSVTTYDNNHNATDIQDFRGNLSHFTYDSMDRRITQSDPLQRSSLTTYDLGGFQVSAVDRANHTTTRSFDGLGRLSSIGYGTTVISGTVSYESTVTLHYDAANRIVNVSDSTAGSIVRTYDGLDRLLSETTPQGSIANTFDLAGRRITAQASTGGLIGYTYDNANKLLNITQGTKQVGFSYDAVGRRTSLSLPNDVIVNYGYDESSRLVSIAYNNTAGNIGNLAYDFDPAGRISDMHGSLAQINLPFALGQAAYDAANQLISWDGTGLTYDLNGNTTTDLSGEQYVWNTRNQLSSVGGTANATFGYDAFGRRISKTVSGQTTTFLFDGLNHIVETTNSAPSILLGGDVDEYYLRSDSGGDMSPLSDGLGSTVATTDATGTLVASYWYAPYGSTTVTGSSNGDSTQFTGRESDGASLYFYRARYYNPTSGRFITQDPAGFAAGLNLYAYAGNDPVSYRDPYGMDKSKPSGGPRWWPFGRPPFRPAGRPSPGYDPQNPTAGPGQPGDPTSPPPCGAGGRPNGKTLGAAANYYDALGTLSMGPNIPYPSSLTDYPFPIGAGVPFIPPTGLEDVNPRTPSGAAGIAGNAYNVYDAYKFYQAYSAIPAALGNDLDKALSPCR